MNIPTHPHSLRPTPVATGARSRHWPARLLAAGLGAGLLAGCSTTAGRPVGPLMAKRDEPGVVLCQSERPSGGGLRITGKLETGIYPITRATIQYRTAGPSDPVPATVDASSNRLELTGARSENVNYRKGAKEVVYTIDADAARGLSGKVLWYRWLITYTKGSSPKTDTTDIHRTSLEEAGLPRAAGDPGPDLSVTLPVTRRR